VDEVVDELGCRRDIDYVRRIMENGTGADRQLRVFRETGDLKAVVDYICNETEIGCESTAEGLSPATLRAGAGA
jgi:carboxylate-amine ligase